MPSEAFDRSLPSSSDPYTWTQTTFESPGIISNEQFFGSSTYDLLSAQSSRPCSAPYQDEQSMPASRPETAHRPSEQLSADDETLSIQMLQLSYEWSRIFCSGHLPALVLCQLFEPHCFDPNGRVAFGPVTYKSSLWHIRERLRRCCGGLLELNAPNDRHEFLLDSPLDSVDLGVDQLIVVHANEAASKILGSDDVRNMINVSSQSYGFDAPNFLASVCLGVLRSSDPFLDAIFHRYLMYLAHILRHGDQFTDDRIRSYLDSVSEIMSHIQSTTPNKRNPWSMLPVPISSQWHRTPLAQYRLMDSLHLRPEFRCFADIHTFAAQEGLPLPNYIEPSHNGPCRRFAINLHALSSWTSRLRADHPLAIFEPSLQRRKSTLRYLLANLTPPESTVCDGRYSLRAEAVRMCNSGAVKEPMDLLAIFLAASRRPDLLWEQMFRPLLGTGCRFHALRDGLREELEYAVAPDLFMRCIQELEQRSQWGEGWDGCGMRRHASRAESRMGNPGGIKMKPQDVRQDSPASW